MHRQQNRQVIMIFFKNMRQKKRKEHCRRIRTHLDIAESESHRDDGVHADLRWDPDSVLASDISSLIFGLAD